MLFNNIWAAITGMDCDETTQEMDREEENNNAKRNIQAAEF